MVINCAIIGCGFIAGGYDNSSDISLIRTHAKAFQENTQTQLVAVCDTNPTIAEEFSKKWNVEHVYTDSSRFFDENNIEILSIASPTHTHFSFLKEAINKKIPHIWLEKPATHSLEELKEMISLAEGSDSKVHLNYFRRYDEGFHKIKEVINQDNVLSVSAHYTKGLRHNGSHLINLLSWLFGEFQKVTNTKVLNDNDFPAVSANLFFDKSEVSMNAYDHKLFEIFELDIILEKSRIRIIDGGQKIEFYEVSNSSYYAEYKNFQLKSVHEGTYGQFMKEGLNSILEGQVYSSLIDELKTREIISFIEEEGSLKSE